MPFESEKQRRKLWATHPKIARRWTEKYGSKPRGSGVFATADVMRGYKVVKVEKRAEG